MSEQRQWSVGIVLFDEVEVLDFAGPFEVFSVAAYEHHVAKDEGFPFIVRTVSEAGVMISACNGLKVQPDYSFANAPHFDIVVVPGGWGAREREIHNESMIRWIQTRAPLTELMTSVCTGSLLLAKAGLLDEKRATTHWASYERFESEFPTVQVVRDVKYVDEGNLLTSGGISAGIHMSFHIVRRLLGVDIARSTAKRMEYDIIFEDDTDV
ncbi:DJ-1/PfpI family protein [Paenibacillus sp. 481]|uniref:DJ-1/PfpI family protein n=1 Tax=Paenibacillus sp. 481 TaxID=2835869 RepID=UPI001E57CDF6|nr:DJ-1/PfpI family protein [Paenibacillus sp. 481]UHA72211.1 DJ-1/PfpI family protein [Paenibacillus sp. 481]